MKSEFEKKLKFAEIGNQMEERFGCEFMVLSRIFKGGARIIAETDDVRIASELLKAFPADEELPLDASARNTKGTIFGLYQAKVERGFKAAFTTLEISWLHGGDEYEFRLKIDGSELLERFFVNDLRSMSISECYTYKPLKQGRLVRDMELPIKRFLCNQIEYEGGYRSATEPERIMEIINAIKEA